MPAEPECKIPEPKSSWFRDQRRQRCTRDVTEIIQLQRRQADILELCKLSPYNLFNFCFFVDTEFCSCFYTKNITQVWRRVSRPGSRKLVGEVCVRWACVCVCVCVCVKGIPLCSFSMDLWSFVLCTVVSAHNSCWLIHWYIVPVTKNIYVKHVLWSKSNQTQ